MRILESKGFKSRREHYLLHVSNNEIQRTLLQRSTRTNFPNLQYIQSTLTIQPFQHIPLAKFLQIRNLVFIPRHSQRIHVLLHFLLRQIPAVQKLHQRFQLLLAQLRQRNRGVGWSSLASVWFEYVFEDIGSCGLYKIGGKLSYGVQI